MTDAHVEHLVKMAQQIALNMAAEGDAQAHMTATHICKFWTPAMREQLLEYGRMHASELPAELRPVLEALAESE